MTWIPISALLASGAPDARPVTFDTDGGTQTLGDLRRDAGGIAWRLRADGAAGAVLVADDTYWFIAGLLGTMHAAVPLVLPPPSHLAALLKELPPGFTFLSDSSRPEGTPGIRLDETVRTAEAASLQPIDAEQAAVTFCTSGSTGLPKQVRKRLLHLECEIATLEAAFGADAGQGKFHTTVANHHIYGILFSVLWPLARGTPSSRQPAEHWAPLLTAMEPDAILVSSPAHLTRLQPVLLRKQLRLVFSSGGPLPLEAAQISQAMLGTVPVEVFGSTETGGVAWRRQTAPGISWQPFPGVALETSPESTLRVRSSLFDEPYIDMGDMVEFGPAGAFTLAGRADRIVKVEGVRVSLAGIEAALVGMPEIEAAAALLLPGSRATIAAVVVPGAAGSSAAESGNRLRLLRRIRQALLPALPRVALPRRVRIVDAIPVNSQGKRIQADLAALFDLEKRPAPSRVDPDVLAVRRLTEGCEIDLFVPRDLQWFQGHFPDLPVLPGVVQIDWAIRLADQHLGLGGRFVGLRNLKFKRVIVPETKLRLRLAERAGNGRLAFEYSADDQSLSAGEVELASA